MLDRYSWEQISIIAESILLDRFGTIEALLTPLMGAAGADYKPGGVEAHRRKSKTHGKHRVHRSQDYAEKDKDKMLMQALSRVGVRVRNTPSAGET